jgi:hypothetical protein
MNRYFFINRFIEIIKNKYLNISKLIICFDPKNSMEKTGYNQLKLHPYGIVIDVDSKKCALEYSKLIELCNNVDGRDDRFDNENYEIIITISEG